VLYVLSYSCIDREALDTFCMAMDGYVPFLKIRRRGGFNWVLELVGE
jgi:hypothetical protein